MENVLQGELIAYSMLSHITLYAEKYLSAEVITSILSYAMLYDTMFYMCVCRMLRYAFKLGVKHY